MRRALTDWRLGMTVVCFLIAWDPLSIRWLAFGLGWGAFWQWVAVIQRRRARARNRDLLEAMRANLKDRESNIT